jgi:hypothetical protein
MGQKRVVAGVAVALALFIGPAALRAITFTELGDAGKTIGTAQFVSTAPPGTALTEIFGNLDLSDADIFAIFVTGGKTFSATTVSNSSNFFDTQLFLFDSLGRGVYGNDDDPGSPPQSTLPASDTLTPVAPGLYYLAISGSGFLPLSAGGLIFPSTVIPGLLDPGVVGPTGPGGGQALTGWSSASNEAGAYDIILTGAEFATSAVPEPSTALILGGGLGLAYLRRYLSTNR